jgi:hypothetical protein
MNSSLPEEAAFNKEGAVKSFANHRQNEWGQEIGGAS